ncbi:MAG: S41 family peptidase [Daejeonella sp.]
MKKNTFRSKNFLIFLVFLFVGTNFFFASCKKEPVLAANTGGNEVNYKAQVDIRDSAYLYTKEIYLWEELLPAIETFKPRNSTDVFAVMAKVRDFQPLDHFSFVEKKTDTDQSNQGLDTDFGFLVKYALDGSLRISYVYSASPGGQAGVVRGWEVQKINGKTIDRSSKSDIDYLNNIFFGTPQSASFQFLKPDGSTVILNIPKGTYPLNTVLYRNVFTTGGKKAGYFVFNQFSGPSSVTELVNTFDYFQVNGINELIIDLRYNRGGFVSTQDTLANMIAPQSVGVGQKVMYQYIFNQKYSEWNDKTMFHKVNSLNLTRVLFIVTPSSASASELLINNLRPVMDVKLVGENHTYGKPVGFFPIPVFDYNIYPVSFKTVNSVGSADYYAGFTVDKITADDLQRDFGDVNETSLKEALNYINTGGFSAIASNKIMSVGSGLSLPQLESVNSHLDANVHKIEVENRPDKMPKPIRDLQRKIK